MELLNRVVKALPDCDVEALISENFTERVDLEGGKVSNSLNGSSVKLELRVSKGLRSAYSWTNDLSKWNDCLLRAKSLMLASSKLDIESPLSTVKGGSKSFVDSSINEVTPEVLRDKGLLVSKNINDAGVFPNGVSLIKSLSNIFFLNSSLACFSESSSSLSVNAECSINDVSCFNSINAPGLSFDFEVFSKELSLLCKDSLSPKKLSPGKYDVVLDYNALQGIMEILMPSLMANNVLEGNSLLNGKIGSKVISDLLTIKDSGIIPGCAGNRFFDYEGVRASSKDLFSKGVLNSFINDLFTAKRLSVKPSGNSGGLLKRGMVLPNQLIILPGFSSNDELLKDCVFVNNVMGVHTANTVTGDFALNALNAFRIDKAGVKLPLRDVMISGNVFDLLSNVKALGRKVRSEAGLSTPLIKFGNVQLIG